MISRLAVVRSRLIFCSHENHPSLRMNLPLRETQLLPWACEICSHITKTSTSISPTVGQKSTPRRIAIVK